MKIRVGRKNPRSLYLQLGDEPSDTDRCLGMIIDPEDAKLMVDGFTSPWHLNEMRLNDDEES